MYTALLDGLRLEWWQIEAAELYLYIPVLFALFVFREGMYPFFVIKLGQTSLWLGYMLQLSLRLLLSEEGWSWWGDWLMYQVIDDEDTP